MNFLNGFRECLSVLKLEEGTLKKCERCCLDVSILSKDTKKFHSILRRSYIFDLLIKML